MTKVQTFKFLLSPDAVIVMHRLEDKLQLEITQGETPKMEVVTRTSDSKSKADRQSGSDKGDSKGDRDIPVKLSDEEKSYLNQKLGPSCLNYWIESLTDFSKNQPAKFKKYSCHFACIKNWHKMRLEKGMVFSHIHPQGPGYYYQRDIDKIPQDKLNLR